MSLLPLKKVKVGAWEWSEWPTLPIPSEEMLVKMGRSKGPAFVNEYHTTREQNILRERTDPLSFGWEQPMFAVLRALYAGTYVPGMIGNGGSKVLVGPDWKQEKPANDVLLLGGNGSGKTDIEAKMAMETLERIPGSEARCWNQNETTSIQYIQKALFKYLRPELRMIKSQGNITKISFKAATGFSEAKFILPTGSVCLFPTYNGYKQDPNSAEGGECDIVTWDEEAPADLVETVRFRAHKKGGVVLGGFTPLQGYTETVGQYIEGRKIIECIPARKVIWDWWKRTWTWGDWILPPDRELVKGCPPGHVPLVVQSGQGAGQRYAIICPTMFNPYTNVASLLAGFSTLRMEEKIEQKLERLWGWPTKKTMPSFPNFSEHHIVKPERVPALKEMTLYHWMDPHGARNWFMLWAGIDQAGVTWVFREWPDGDVGEWALPGKKPDGKIGPGQTAGHGKSFNDYKRLVYEIEGWAADGSGVWSPGANAWTVQDRRLDPRPAGTAVPSAEEPQTYTDYLNDPICDSAGRVLAPGLDCAPGVECGVEEGKQWVNDLLTRGWNPQAPVTPMNCPKFYVSAECVNLIWAMRTWTGADGEKGACKDPIDCLKGLAKMGLEYVPPGGMGSYGGGSY